MKTPKIVREWLDWYAAQPRWMVWAPVAGVLFLWTLLVLA